MFYFKIDLNDYGVTHFSVSYYTQIRGSGVSSLTCGSAGRNGTAGIPDQQLVGGGVKRWLWFHDEGKKAGRSSGVDLFAWKSDTWAVITTQCHTVLSIVGLWLKNTFHWGLLLAGPFTCFPGLTKSPQIKTFWQCEHRPQNSDQQRTVPIATTTMNSGRNVSGPLLKPWGVLH